MTNNTFEEECRSQIFSCKPDQSGQLTGARVHFSTLACHIRDRVDCKLPSPASRYRFLACLAHLLGIPMKAENDGSRVFDPYVYGEPVPAPEVVKASALSTAADEYENIFG